MLHAVKFDVARYSIQIPKESTLPDIAQTKRLTLEYTHTDIYIYKRDLKQ